MHRLFVGIRPPAAIRALLLDKMSGAEGVRWQDDEQLHITLRYIGEVERPVAEDIAAMLGQVMGRRSTCRSTVSANSIAAAAIPPPCGQACARTTRYASSTTRSIA